MVALLLLFGFATIILVLICLINTMLIPKRVDFDFANKHALVTGIGKAIASDLVSRGASVTIIARNAQSLKETCDQLQDEIMRFNRPNQRVQYFVFDMTKSAQESVIRKSETTFGSVDLLINNVGHSVEDQFEKLPENCFEQLLKVNYLSAVYASRAVIPAMKTRKCGRIAFISSGAGQVGIFGFTAYSSAKFALRGLAEALQMELEPFNIAITVIYPPNTNTEGFQEELRMMSKEMSLISDSAGVYQPGTVAKCLLNDVRKGKYCSTVGLEGWMMGVATAGGAPETNIWDALAQIFLSGIFRLIFLGYHRYFRNVVQKCSRERKDEQYTSEEN